MLDRAREDPNDKEDVLAALLPAFSRPSSPWTSISMMKTQFIEDRLHHEICQDVSWPGIFEILVAAQAPQHLTPSKVRKPTFPQGLPVCVGSLEKSTHRNLLCL